MFFQIFVFLSGKTTHVGLGHSAIVSAVRFSPDGKYIVSASASGSIFIWENPFGFQEQKLEGSGDQQKKEEQPHKRSIRSEEEKEENISQASARSKASSKGSGKAASNKGSEKSTASSKKCGCREGKTCCKCQEKKS